MHLAPASVASGPPDASRCADYRSARQQQASLGRYLADVASKRLVAQRKGDGPRPNQAYARRSSDPKRQCPTRRPAARGVYQPRRPHASPLFRLVSDHLYRLQTVYNDRFARECGPWRPVVTHVADKFLACGVLEHGFARIRCDACTYAYPTPARTSAAISVRIATPSAQTSVIDQILAHFRARAARESHGEPRSPPTNAGPREPGHVTPPAPVRPRPDRPMSTPPRTPRDPAGPFSVRGPPTGASNWSPPASSTPR